MSGRLGAGDPTSNFWTNEMLLLPNGTVTTLSIVLGLAGATTADTINVPGDQPTIAAGLDAAQDGDTIAIAAGTYYEADLFPRTADLLIIGEVDASGNPMVTIDASNWFEGVTMGFGIVGSEGATVENIEFTGSTGSAVWIYHHAPTIRNCIFDGNASVFSGVAVWSMDSEATFENCRFTNNVGTTGSIFLCGGIDEGESGPTIRDSVFCGNQTETSVIEGTWTDGGNNTFDETCPDCLGDFNGDDIVNGADLSIILGFWGPCSSSDCMPDLDGDGVVGGADLTLILGNWGNCW